MIRRFFFLVASAGLLNLFLGMPSGFARDLTPTASDPRISVRLLETVRDPERPCRIAKDPRNDTLYYMTLGGSISRLRIEPGDNLSTRSLVADASSHGQTNTMGFAIGPDGTFYVVGNHTSSTNNAFTWAVVMRGTQQSGSEKRAWSVVAYTAAYARSKTAFDHVFNAVEVSPDGRTLYLNSGSRTDHGEIQAGNGAFPNLREESLTATIFRVPADGTNTFLPRDLDRLRAEGRIFCEGIRNTFDLRFSPSGELFGTENGPDRGMSDELNWLREGRHYGFPWRMGGTDNPQQYSDYDPAKDKLLDPLFTAVKAGYYSNDPTFPPAPARMMEPVQNLGPDADKFRDSFDGLVKDASDLGLPFATFTAHRSPLGIAFDEKRAMAAPYQGDAFVMGFSSGDATGDRFQGPFEDASSDLLHLHLKKVGENYEATVSKLVTGLNNPIDNEVIANRIFIICFGYEYSIWEVTMPAVNVIELSNPTWTPAGYSFTFNVNAAGVVRLEISTDLLEWKSVWSAALPAGSSYFIDGSASPISGSRYYRAVREPDVAMAPGTR